MTKEFTRGIRVQVRTFRSRSDNLPVSIELEVDEILIQLGVDSNNVNPVKSHGPNRTVQRDSKDIAQRELA